MFKICSFHDALDKLPIAPVVLRCRKMDRSGAGELHSGNHPTERFGSLPMVDRESPAIRGLQTKAYHETSAGKLIALSQARFVLDLRLSSRRSPLLAADSGRQFPGGFSYANQVKNGRGGEI
jgi:hypothetical protein